MARVLGLDVGDARIGLAISDPLRILASPLRIITRQNPPADIAAILDVIQKNGVDLLIVGLPYNMDGTLGEQADKVRGFIDELKKQTDIPVDFRDERLSTVRAKEYLQKVRKASPKTRYDAAAAALVLQEYLDAALPPREIPEDRPPE